MAKQLKPKPTGLVFLKLLTSDIVVPTLTNPFIVRDNFKEDVSDEAVVKISHLGYTGYNFQKWFLNQTIKSRAGYSLTSYKLGHTSLGQPILDGLGGVNKVKTDLAAVSYLMSLQPQGQKGILLIDGRVNMFYCIDVNGILRAVYVYWYGGGWGVDTYSVEGLDPWGGGSRVFSRL